MSRTSSSRSTAAGALLITSFVLFLAFALVMAMSDQTTRLADAAAERGIPYVNGTLPLDAYADVLRADAAPWTTVVGTLSIVPWAAFAVGIWLLGSSGGSLRVGARVTAVLAGVGWLGVLASEATLVTAGATGFPSFYVVWFGVTAAVSFLAAVAVGLAALALQDRAARALRVIIIVLAAVLAAASLILAAGGGIPPIVGPLLGAVLGAGVVVRARRRARRVRQAEPVAA